jgi:hypothetical protein
MQNTLASLVIAFGLSTVAANAVANKSETPSPDDRVEAVEDDLVALRDIVRGADDAVAVPAFTADGALGEPGAHYQIDGSGPGVADFLLLDKTEVPNRLGADDWMAVQDTLHGDAMDFLLDNQLAIEELSIRAFVIVGIVQRGGVTEVVSGTAASFDLDGEMKTTFLIDSFRHDLALQAEVMPRLRDVHGVEIAENASGATEYRMLTPGNERLYISIVWLEGYVDWILEFTRRYRCVFLGAMVSGTLTLCITCVVGCISPTGLGNIAGCKCGYASCCAAFAFLKALIRECTLLNPPAWLQAIGIVYSLYCFPTQIPDIF